MHADVDQVGALLTHAGGSVDVVTDFTFRFGLVEAPPGFSPDEAIGAQHGVELVRFASIAQALGLTEKLDEALDHITFDGSADLAESVNPCRIPPPHMLEARIAPRYLLGLAYVVLSVKPEDGSALARLAERAVAAART